MRRRTAVPVAKLVKAEETPESFYENIPVPKSPRPTSRSEVSWDSGWGLEFKEYIRYMMRFLRYSSDPVPKELFESSSESVQQPHIMNLWLKAFIHNSVSFGAVDYGTLETLGDSASKYAFKRYLRIIYPNVSDEEMTNLSNYYMSKHYQPLIAKRFKMNIWLIHDLPSLTDSVYEDLFESFCGAFEEVQQRIYTEKIKMFMETTSDKTKLDSLISVKDIMPGNAIVRLFIFYFGSSGGLNERHKDASGSTILIEYSKVSIVGGSNKAEIKDLLISGNAFILPRGSQSFLSDRDANMMNEFTKSYASSMKQDPRASDEIFEATYNKLREIGKGVFEKNKYIYNMQRQEIKDAIRSLAGVDFDYARLESFQLDDSMYAVIRIVQGGKKITVGKPVILDGQSRTFESVLQGMKRG